MGCEIVKMVECFWCRDVQSLAIGNAKSMKAHKEWCEAPSRIILNYGPCPKCAKDWDKGLVVIEATETQPKDKRPSINKDEKAYPTGKLWVIQEKKGREAFNLSEDAPSLILITPGVAESSGLYDLESKEGKEK